MNTRSSRKNQNANGNLNSPFTINNNYSRKNEYSECEAYTESNDCSSHDSGDYESFSGPDFGSPKDNLKHKTQKTDFNNIPTEKVKAIKKKVIKVHKKTKFTPEEDEKLQTLIELYGDDDWNTVSAQMDGRNKRQCRERWRHYLAPEVSTEPFTPEEDALLHEKYAEYGHKWKLIAAFFPNRTDITIKNRWLFLHRQYERNLKSMQNATCNYSSDYTSNYPYSPNCVTFMNNYQPYSPNYQNVTNSTYNVFNNYNNFPTNVCDNYNNGSYNYCSNCNSYCFSNGYHNYYCNNCHFMNIGSFSGNNSATEPRSVTVIEAEISTSLDDWAESISNIEWDDKEPISVN
ncbi:hypothetical protein TRFO_02204 [Tritrichomonas foetus]|uniref:Myb-like DNA-binding domain containing protein n=1 Tax=Tritrichomonas foetus TaxID=1144522 RepID=A0A1J4J7M9_9EUKA|nr:hypothetical protein TRFO_02204 [Tritrichomonas foetus]|eukprot:OHS95230.1 hypothetical protein TRFO_02204 [Tritrichomonas foetus]